MSKKILVTGGAGFIGSNFVPYFLEANPDLDVVNLDKMTYAADEKNLAEVQKNPRYTFVKGDIADKEFVEKVFKEFDIRGVIHFAAESHVDNSITGPEIFVKTNVLGTFNLLESARKLWQEKPHTYKKEYVNCRFHHVSTDEVYGTLGETGAFMETTPYAPNSPYSASKASSDFFVRSYFHTFGMNVTTSNCSNNYGPKQHGEKLIPTIIRNCMNETNIPVYGTGKNVRDWLYVLDHCIAINLVYHKGKMGETYNVGGASEKTNLQIIDTICAYLDVKKPRQNGKKYVELMSFVADRPGHDLRYAIDFAKLHNELGWQPAESFTSGIEKTVDWYLNNIFNKG